MFTNMKLDRRVCCLAGSTKLHIAIMKVKILKYVFCSGQVHCVSYNTSMFNEVTLSSVCPYRWYFKPFLNIKSIIFKVVKNKFKHIYFINSFHMMFNNHKAPKNGSVCRRSCFFPPPCRFALAGAHHSGRERASSGSWLPCLLVICALW